MKKWLLHTETDWKSASADICIHDLKRLLEARGYEATTEYKDASSFDVAVIMGYDYALFKRLRAQNPRLLIGVGDPKRTKLETARMLAREADFVFLSSTEQRDAFLDLTEKSFIYLMFPEYEAPSKAKPENKTPIVGYHGNFAHLSAFESMVENELCDAARAASFEFNCVYDHKSHGAVPFRRLSELAKVNHIQWSRQTLMAELNKCDIGVVPNFLPIPCAGVIKNVFRSPKKGMSYESGDFLHRYKLSTNPGRIYPFALCKTVVIADATPSASQLVLDNITGRLVCTPAGWKAALIELLACPSTRARLAGKMTEHIHQHFSRERNFQNFLAFVDEKWKQKQKEAKST
jgi:glycosyltransferase involved in cell wall biosynthesis